MEAAITRSNKVRASIALLLIVVIVAGSLIIWSKYRPGQAIEVAMPPSTEINGQIAIAGGVNVPGVYPLRNGDSVDALIQAAGGTTADADLDIVQLYVPCGDEATAPQKVNLNHAEAWLLQALPSIGETRARAIIDYRQRNGPFHHISEITGVDGIGAATYQNIKHLITVAD